MSTAPGSITSYANGLRLGAPPEQCPAMSAIYETLIDLARSGTRSLRGVVEIRTGDLVHDAYLKLFARPTDKPWESRRHFFGSAARAMQQVVVDIVRRVEVERRHSGRVAVTAVAMPEIFTRHSVLELGEALAALEEVDPAAAEIVRLRYFAGIGMRETAEILRLPQRSAERKWNLARAWLLNRMKMEP